MKFEHSEWPEMAMDLHATLGVACVGKTKLYGLVNSGNFPPPIKIGRSSRWLKTEVLAWLAERAANRQLQKRGG